LVDAARALVAAANKDPDFAGVFTLLNTGSPSIYADIDRLKVEKVGLTPTDVFSTLQVYRKRRGGGTLRSGVSV
jgi:multidrug efflux pump subunit AcrB